MLKKKITLLCVFAISSFLFNACITVDDFLGKNDIPAVAVEAPTVDRIIADFLIQEGIILPAFPEMDWTPEMPLDATHKQREAIFEQTAVDYELKVAEWFEVNGGS